MADYHHGIATNGVTTQKMAKSYRLQRLQDFFYKYIIKNFRRDINVFSIIELAANGLHPVKRNVAADKPALVLSNDSKNKIFFLKLYQEFQRLSE